MPELNIKIKLSNQAYRWIMHQLTGEDPGKTKKRRKGK
jgi:hypothetical protein